MLEWEKWNWLFLTFHLGNRPAKTSVSPFVTCFLHSLRTRHFSLPLQNRIFTQLPQTCSALPILLKTEEKGRTPPTLLYSNAQKWPQDDITSGGYVSLAEHCSSDHCLQSHLTRQHEPGTPSCWRPSVAPASRSKSKVLGSLLPWLPRDPPPHTHTLAYAFSSLGGSPSFCHLQLYSVSL
jgi:hypothetical protein